MNAKEKIIKCLKNPKWILVFLNNRGLHFLNDKNYLSLLYKLETGRNLNLDNPILFNEKMQWLKIHDRKDIYSMMVDKYEAKKYVGKIIGEKYIIPTLGIYDNFEDIDFDALPKQFVIKCTHDSGGLVIVKDKSKLNVTSAKNKINKCLKKNFYWTGREWPYKNVKPRIIVEKYMTDENSSSMKDYKFFCFNGVPKIMYLSEGLENHKTAAMSFFDMNFELVNCKRKDYKLLKYQPSKPRNFEKMKEFASLLSSGIPHLRVDFYEINGELFFGELTFYTNSGMIPFENEEWNYKMGEMLELPKKKISDDNEK